MVFICSGCRGWSTLCMQRTREAGETGVIRHGGNRPWAGAVHANWALAGNVARAGKFLDASRISNAVYRSGMVEFRADGRLEKAIPSRRLITCTTPSHLSRASGPRRLDPLRYHSCPAADHDALWPVCSTTPERSTLACLSALPA